VVVQVAIIRPGPIVGKMMNWAWSLSISLAQFWQSQMPLARLAR